MIVVKDSHSTDNSFEPQANSGHDHQAETEMLSLELYHGMKKSGLPEGRRWEQGAISKGMMRIHTLLEGSGASVFLAPLQQLRM
jgi:hypothetical protein